MTTLDISFNGERLATGAATLEGLLLERGLDLKAAFACAINNGFVPRTQWAARALQSGDRVDVISPIAGG